MENRSILVLDDDIELAILFKMVLQRQGLSVFSFTDPIAALDHFRANRKNYSLILTDLRIPGMSGIEFANKIREIDKKVTVWLITAFMMEDLQNNEEFISAKISEVIEKPVSMELLTKLVKSEINNFTNK